MPNLIFSSTSFGWAVLRSPKPHNWVKIYCNKPPICTTLYCMPPICKAVPYWLLNFKERECCNTPPTFTAIRLLAVRLPFVPAKNSITAGNFPEIFWLSPYQVAHKTWKKGQKSTGKYSKSSMEEIPQSCKFLSLVVVERVQSLFEN